MAKDKSKNKSKSSVYSDDKLLNRYYLEIGKTPLLNKKEEISLAKKSVAGDLNARDALVTANLRFVVSVAKQYRGQGLPLEDLINDGNIGLIKATKRFDHTRGFRFISYAVWWIRQSIMESLAKNSRIVRLPMNRVGDMNKINKLAAKLEQELGRIPNPDEIARISFQFSAQEIIDNQSIKNSHLSIDAPFSDNGENNSLKDVLEDMKIISPDVKMSQEELIVIINKLLNTLKPREAHVLTLFMGLDGRRRMTLEEIGTIFSLTRERIRQIKDKAIIRLRHSSRARHLIEFYHD